MSGSDLPEYTLLAMEASVTPCHHPSDQAARSTTLNGLYEKRLSRYADSLDPDTVYLSVITLGELRKGIEKLALSRRKGDLMIWLTTDLLLRFADKIIDITTDCSATRCFGRRNMR